MTTEKKYFWFKMKEDFFRDKAIKKLRKQAGGDTLTIIYLKMLLLSLRQNGRLLYEGVEDTFAEEIALDIDEDSDNVKMALMWLLKIGLIEEISESEIFLNRLPESVGKETRQAEIMRKKRSGFLEFQENGNNVTQNGNNVTQSGNNVTRLLQDVTKCYTEIDIDIEKDIEIDKEKREIESAKADSDEPDGSTSPSLFDKEEEIREKKRTKPQVVRHKYGEYNNVLLTDDELMKLKEKIPNWQDFIERLSGYIASTGKRYKSHYVTMLNWYRRDGQRQQARQTQQTQQETRIMCEYNNGITNDLDDLF